MAPYGMNERVTHGTAIDRSGQDRGATDEGLRALIRAVCDVGPRPHGAGGCARARRVLARALEDAGVAPYRGDDLEARDPSGIVNLLGVVPGRERHRRPLVLASHYDGPPDSVGAGDNAAAAALVVALAADLASLRLERDVIVALLDGGDLERPASLAHGAEVFMRSQRRHDVKAAVLVDRIGHAVPARQGPGLLAVGVESEPRLPALLDALSAAPLTIAPIARRRLGVAPAADALRADDTPYLWISAGRAPHHRGPDDRPEHLDDAALVATLDMVRTLVEALARTRLPGPCGEHAIDEFERAAWDPWRRGERGDAHAAALRTALARLDLTPPR